jgi:hypothetical protein
MEPTQTQAEFRNEVLAGPYPGTLAVKLTKGKTAIVDDTEVVRKILVEYRFHTGPGYAATNVPIANVSGRRATVFLHSLVAEATLGSKPEGMQVDHINGDPLDDRAMNLRYVSVRVNKANMNRPYRSNTSGSNGVFRREKGRRWVAQWQDGARAGARRCRSFPDARHGGSAGAFEAAKAHREAETAKLPVYVEARKRLTERTITNTNIEKITEFK